MNDSLEVLAQQIAVVCHEVNRAWCEQNNDLSQKSWHEAEPWQRESAIKGVLFRLNNPSAGHDAQHNAWMAEKIAAGWVYGEEKNTEAKTHPCLVPFEQLPEFQQKKDALFCAVVDSLAPKVFKTTNLSFGDAIQALKQGKRIARAGWNGKGLFIFMQVPAKIDISIVPKMQSLPQSVKDVFLKRDVDEVELGNGSDTMQSIKYKNQMAIVYPDNTISGWVPSASDTLEEDWQILD